MSSSRPLLPLLLVLAACGGPRDHYADERFDAESRHRRDFSAAKAELCDAGRRVLLAQGYLVERREDGGDVVLAARKEFKEKDTGHAVLEIQALCSDRNGGHKGATLFVTALESRYGVAQVEEKTSVGLPLVSPLSVSSSRNSETQLKRGGATVDDRDFYEALFRAVARELGGR